MSDNMRKGRSRIAGGSDIDEESLLEVLMHLSSLGHGYHSKTALKLLGFSKQSISMSMFTRFAVLLPDFFCALGRICEAGKPSTLRANAALAIDPPLCSK